MKDRVLLCSLVPLLALACSASPQQGSSTSGAAGQAAPGEDVGEATAAITKVPGGIGCVDIQAASGQRVVDRQFTVTPGQGALLTLQGLPLGSVVFNGFAYATACSAVTASSVAVYATNPLTATLVPGVRASLEMAFHLAGSASIGVDFDDAGVAGTIAITPAQVGFSVLFCGASGQSQSVSVQNITANPITVTGATTAGAPLSLSPTSAALAPGASASFVVTETPVAAPHVIGLINSSITLTTNVVFDAPHVIAAPVFIGSALFQLSPSTLVGNGVVTLTNAGNEAAPFTLTKSPATSLVTIAPSSGTLAPGQSVGIQVSATLFGSPTTIQLSSPNELCQLPPSFTFTP